MALTQAERNFINRSVATITALKAVEVVPRRDGSIVNVTAAQPDGGQFRWNATSTATDDDKTVVLSSHSAVGRWIKDSEQIGDAYNSEPNTLVKFPRNAVINEINGKFADMEQPNGFRDLDDTFIDFTPFYFEAKVTVTQADSHLYSIDINTTTFQYTSGIGQTAQQIVAEIAKTINVGSEPASVLDNGDGTYTTTTTDHTDGIQVLNTDIYQTITSYQKQFGITPDTNGFIETPSSLTSSGGVATLIVHQDSYAKFINGHDITIETTDQADYNGVFVGTKGAPNQITYPISGTPVSPATGAIKVTYVRNTYEFYSDSKKYDLGSPRYISLWFNDSPSIGLYLIYFNGNGTISRNQLTSSPSSYPFQYSPPAFLARYAACAIVYWPDSAGSYLLNDYRFNYGDAKLHEQWLQVNGLPVEEGLELQSFTLSGTGSTNAEAQFNVEDGVIWFFDVKFFIRDGQPQDLSFPAKLPVYYLEGNNWQFDEPSVYPFKNVITGTERVAYNLISGGTTGSQIECSNGYVVPYYVFASTNTRFPIGVIQGQTQYVTREQARKEAEYDWLKRVLPTINNLGFPYSISVGADLKLPKPIGLFLVETDDSYTNTPHAKIIKYDDFNDLAYLDLRKANPQCTSNERNNSPYLVHIDDSGSDSEGDGSWDAPFLNFDGAIAKAKTFNPTQSSQVDIVAKFKVAATLNFFDLSGVTGEWINIYLPGQRLRMAATSVIGSNNVVTAASVTLSVATTTNVIRKTGSGHSTLNVGKLYSTNASQPLVFFENAGGFEINANEVLANSDSDFILDTAGDVSGGYCIINANRSLGRIETNAINFQVTYNTNNHLGGRVDLNANSTIDGALGDWTGLINSAGASAKVRLTTRKRHSDPGGDNHDATASILIDELEKPYLHAYLSANQPVGVSTITDVIFDTLEGTPYQMSLNPITGEVTIKTNGVYEVESGLAYAIATQGQSREVYVYVNGALLAAKDTERQQLAAQDKQNSNLVAKLKLKKGDLVKASGYSDANPAVNIAGTATYKNETFIKLTKIGNFS